MLSKWRTLLNIVNTETVSHQDGIISWLEDNYAVKIADGKIHFGNFKNKHITNSDTGNFDIGRTTEPKIISCINLSSVIKSVFHFIYENLYTITYFTLGDPYNCLVVVVQPISESEYTYTALNSTDSALQIWDSLTYFDEKLEMGIHIISDKKYDLTVTANTIPTWNIVTENDISKPTLISATKQNTKSYTFKSLFKYFHFILNRVIKKINIKTSSGEFVDVDVGVKQIHTNSGTLSNDFHYVCELPDEILFQNDEYIFEVEYPVKFLFENNRTICLSPSEHDIKYCSENKILITDKKTAFVVCYCFDQKSNTHFGSYFVNQILSQLKFKIDDNIIITDSENLAEIHTSEQRYVDSTHNIVIGKIKECMFEGISESGQVVTTRFNTMPKYIDSMVQSDEAIRFLAPSEALTPVKITEYMAAFGVIVFILLFCCIYKSM